ncbi:IS200/IS605 family accessory protein TnpB-related protein [Cereibacter sphaeroides]|uniref:IS200/IS605 family accessory protein TnpB-related protein n=1 Tax=Cereibacter sphaeroides TaxID=1063 RepID=UPI001F3317C6|nr:IS200/IS605 family accessory protein TnpB-related protein [Cereibacter sphaeroides]MCE6958821.1 IS200/IS605 family accessory protein TnpB-related protein [Cereibacter sphaeroides]MCE6973305.1 IS200/IS605 family accessory protein TnpB-related protein [Cereibacter sphaeroides]
MIQTRTFQFRLPKGAHEEILARWGDLAGRARRELHVRRVAIEREVMALPARTEEETAARAALRREHENALKSAMIRDFGLTGRQFNGLAVDLAGLWSSRRECAAAEAETLKAKIKAREAALAEIGRKLDRDRKARETQAARAAAAQAKGKPAPLPTASGAKAMLRPERRAALRFSLHQGKRKLGTLRHRLARAEAEATPGAIPAIVFGGRGLLRERARLHPNDLQGIAAWRRRWEAARSAGFLLVGGSDEAAGNKSCKLMSDPDGGHRLWLRLPDGLGAGREMEIRGLQLPGFGGNVLRAAVERNAKLGERIALAFRFLCDPDFRHDSLSAWRVCVTIREELPEAPTAIGRWLGVDVNADHLALALIDSFGNPTGSFRIELPLRGRSAGHRAALIGDAAAQVTALARKHEAAIVLEHLDFAKKKRELGQARARRTAKGRAHARMLSAFAYGAVREGISRRAARLGIAVRSVNPAYTSLIGETNYAARYGLTRHQAAAVAIARRSAGFSERMHRNPGDSSVLDARNAPVEARRHMWTRWAILQRARIASAAIARRTRPADPPGRGAVSRPGRVGRACPARLGG